MLTFLSLHPTNTTTIQPAHCFGNKIMWDWLIVTEWVKQFISIYLSIFLHLLCIVASMYSWYGMHTILFCSWQKGRGRERERRRKRDGQTFSFDKFMVMTTCGFFSYDNDDDDYYDDHNDNCSYYYSASTTITTKKRHHITYGHAGT